MRLRTLLLQFLTIATLLFCKAGHAQIALDDTDLHYLQLALRAQKMTLGDLSFKKDHVAAEFLLPEVRRFLQQPLTLPEYGAVTLSKLRAVSNLVTLAELDLGKQPPIPPGPPPSSLEYLPPSVTPAIRAILATVESFRPVTPPQAPALAAFAVESLQLDAQSPALADFPPLTSELLARQDRLELQDNELAELLLTAGRQWDQAAQARNFLALLRVLDKVGGDLRQQRFTEEFQITINSPRGPIIVGGVGPNVYREEAFLILDLGGDDVYENSAGGANGLENRPVAIVIDLAGNDRYLARRGLAQGAGIFGIGILIDCAGDDVYEASHLSQGAGFFGFGLLADYGGRDKFTATSHSQGAATFGAGILWQRGGDTTYEAQSFSQGFGRTGGFGLLFDAGGDDSYTARGDAPCPWLPGHKFTLSQGFGYGMRPFAAGGIGVLADLQGNDRYIADVYGQGASYWYAAGLLLDAAGDDTYTAHQYCQGAGIHLSAGLLADAAGNDTYQAGQICQGGAHDYSVGMLIDRVGNDRYAANSTAQGSAINNSFALLLDRAGDDHYTGTDRNQSQAAGHDGGKREYGSIALLLDLAGDDFYSQNHTNNTLWLKPWYGCGLDLVATTNTQRQPRSAPVRTGPPTPPSIPYHPVDPHHPTERLLRLALSSQPGAAVAWDKLKDSGTEAFPYLLTRLDSPNVSIRAKIEELIDHLGTNSVPALITGIAAAGNDEQARLCAYFLARFESATNAIPAVLPLLQRPQTQATALYTLGHLRARPAYTPALRFLRDPRETIRLRAAQALGRIGDRRATPRLIAALDDDLWTVRYAAQDALVALGKPNIPALRRAYTTASHRARPHLIEALVKLDDPRAFELAKIYWQKSDPRLRVAVEKYLQENRPAHP